MMPILVFDFDSTLVSVEGLDELFARSLAAEPDREAQIQAFREVTDLGMAGAISAEESLERRLRILRADRELVGAVGHEIAEAVTPSVRRARSFFSDHRERIFVVSGGFEELILPTIDRLGLSPERLFAHRFTYDGEGRVTGLDPGTPLARGGKSEAVRAIPPGEEGLWIIGDGATDLELREVGLADRFVAFTENRHRDPVVDRADYVARSMDDLFSILEMT